MEQTAKIIRLPQVRALVGLGKTAIYDKIKDGQFPKPIKMGRVSGWLECDVAAWINKHVQNQRGGVAALDNRIPENREMKRVTRRQIRSWLVPIRACFAQIKTGEVDSIKGYAVTRLDHKDEYARIDHCIAGFRALLARLCPEIMSGQLERIEKKLANGVPLTVAEIDDALALLHCCEDALIRHSVDTIKSAVLTEQCVIEMDSLLEAA